LTVITFINFVSHLADLITAISFISVWPSGPRTTNIYEVKVADFYPKSKNHEQVPFFLRILGAAMKLVCGVSFAFSF